MKVSYLYWTTSPLKASFWPFKRPPKFYKNFLLLHADLSLPYQVQTAVTPKRGKNRDPKLICYKAMGYASTGHFLTFLKLGPATKLRALVDTRRLPVVALNDEARRNLQIQVFHPRWSCTKKKTVPSSIPSYKKVVGYLVLSSQI